MKTRCRLRLAGALMLLPVVAGATSGALLGPSARPAATAAALIADVRYGVGTITLDLVDTQRNRRLPTTINYPAAPGTSGTGVPSATGSFPLVVAGHGSQGNGPGAAGLHRFLTEAGYVVAAPTFPSGFDFPNMARDVSFVITKVLEQSAGGSGPLAGHVNGERIGYIGTSMGGMTGLSLYQSCCHDPRIDAVISKIGTAPGGTYDWQGGPPLLMINGDSDNTIHYEDALATYRQAAPPKGLITLRGVGHDLNVGTSRILQDAPLGFFAFHLLGQADGLSRVQAAVDATPIASLQAEWTGGGGTTKTDQTITFAALPDRTLGDPPFGVSATASSGLAVTFTTSTPAVCSSGGTNGATITLQAAGTCTVTATQAGNTTYNPAPPVARSFTVQTKSNQTISFGSLPNRKLRQYQFQVSATASSGLPVSFTTTTPGVCTAGGTYGRTITLRSVGTCTVRASQAGSASYYPAPMVSRSFRVSR